VGWAIPTGLVAAWLVNGGAWQAFLRQAFTEGSASKGTFGEIPLRPLTTLLYSPILLLAFFCACGLMCLYALVARRDRRPEVAARTGEPWVLWLLSLLALAAGFVWAWSSPKLKIFGPVEIALIFISAICIFISLYGSLALAARYTLDAVRGRLDNAGMRKWILASVCAVTAYMFSLSWAAYEKMLIPGFAFLIAMALDREVNRGWSAKGGAIVALGLILVCTAAFRKLTWPYTWENWVDGPVKEETAVSDFPEMRGLRVTPESARFLDRVTRIIDSHSRPDETILCFPNYALFYVLSHRSPATFAYMHWFDIVPDSLAREEANRIREHPPAVILYVDLPENLIEIKELSYRAGRRSGQRDMMSAIQSLPGYRVIETVPIPHVDYGLKIYAR
jgi:hypothetical protein